MAFFKKIAHPLAFLLASAAYAKADEAKQQNPEAEVTMQQILETSKTAATKTANEMPFIKEKPAETKQPNWTITELRLGLDIQANYTIPNGFRMRPDGTLEGGGLRWKIGSTSVYYNDSNLKDYFDHLGEGSYKSRVTIGDEDLGDVIARAEDEYGLVDNDLYRITTELQDGLFGIYQQKYTEQFAIGLVFKLFWIMPEYARDNEMTPGEYVKISGPIEMYVNNFYAEDVDEEDKHNTMGLLNAFSDQLQDLLLTTTSDEVLLKAMGDPGNSISVGDKKLSEFQNLVDGLSPFVKVNMDERGITAKGEITGKGALHGELTEEYYLRLGEKKAKFKHAIATDYGLHGKAYLDATLETRKGEPIYLYITDEGIKLQLEELGGMLGFHMNLLDLDLDSRAGYSYQSTRHLSESFQYEEATRTGREGSGIVYSTERETKDKGAATLKGKLDTHTREVSLNFFAEREQTSSLKEGTLIYRFSEGRKRNIWYYGMMGAEPYAKVTYGNSQRITLSAESPLDVLISGEADPKVSSDSQKHTAYDQDTSIAGHANIALGTTQEILNPFASYSTYPKQKLRMGLTLETKPLAIKLAMQNTSDTARRMKNNPEREGEITSETTIALFDKDSEAKIADYHIKTEQTEASQTPDKMHENRQHMTNLYSELDGLLITAKTENSDASLRLAWAASSPLYLGAGYLTNIKEKTKGGEITIGYDNLSLITSLSMNKSEKYHGSELRISAGGTIKGISTYADLNGTMTTEPEERYYKEQIYKSGITGTINISGPFDEIKLLRMLSRSKP